MLDQFEGPPENTGSPITKNGLALRLADFYAQIQSEKVKQLSFTAPGGEAEILQQMKELQRTQIPLVYQDTELDVTPLPVHALQRKEKSCQLATATNIINALGGEIVSEEDIAGAIESDGTYANIWPNSVMELLKKRGFDVGEIHSAYEAIEALIGGAKVALSLIPPAYPIPHYVAITGISIDKGKVMFYINNPQYNNTPEPVPLDFVINAITPSSYNKLGPSYFVAKKAS